MRSEVSVDQYTRLKIIVPFMIRRMVGIKMTRPEKVDLQYQLVYNLNFLTERVTSKIFFDFEL